MPVPVLVRPPTPEMTPKSPDVVPSVSTVPLAARLTARVLAAAAVIRSVPPMKVSAAEGSPSWPSAEIESVPWLIVQGVTALVEPVSVQMLVPAFSNVSKFRYCAAAPMADVSKLLSAAPPSRRISLVPLPATTLPTIVEPA